jgi:hypothetical protein
MKKLIFIIFFLSILSPKIFAQNVSYDSVQLANLLVERQWSSLDQIVKLMEPGLTKELEKSGATIDASRILIEEMYKNFNKNNVGRGFAKFISDEFTPSEVKQLLEFWQSPVAEKYMKLVSSEKQAAAIVSFVMKEACASANNKLSFFDRGSINQSCRGLQ